jgi:mannan endo-1,4-beta-mannosidase
MLGQRRFSKQSSSIWTRGPSAAGIIALGALTSCATPLTRQPATRASQTHTLSARGPLTQSVAPASPAAPHQAAFVSFNVPNLHYIEDDWRFTSTVRYRLPNEYEIYDGLQTVRLLGGTVIRIYALSVRKPTDTPELVRHVTGPGQFNESSFQVLDRVLADAANLGIRVIVPFVDNWAYWGGVAEYAGFRGKPRDAFFDDAEVISDFKKTVEHVILRTNSVNGRLYRDDPAVYAWETGNELASPDRWVTQIARFIKQLDSKHALIDGTYGPRIREHALVDPNIDIVSSHHYGPARRTLQLIDANVRVIGGKKRYFIGEFGLLSAADTERVLHHALSKNVEGVLLWSLRFHDRDGGFYCHMEKPPFQAYHFPGFASGHDYEEQPIMQLMRRFAFEARGMEVPALPTPAPPALLPVTGVAEIRWRGSVGARYYVVERETIGTGHWQIVGNRVDETQTPYRAGFVDDSAPVGSKVRYRVVAGNESGLSPPSLPSEELTVTKRVWVDEMADDKAMAARSGPLQFTTDHAELCKMDRNRVAAKAGARIVYRLSGRPHAVRIFGFAQQPGNVFDLSFSANGHGFSTLSSSEQSFSGVVDEPVALHPVLATAASVPSAAREIAIGWLMPAEIGRVEIDWSP